MTTAIDPHRTEIQHLCRQFGVQQLDVFGSAAGEGFDPVRSDVDFVVDFGPGEQPDLFTRYFSLMEALEQLLGRSVDLVMAGAMVNPYFIDSVNRTRQPAYARTLACIQRRSPAPTGSGAQIEILGEAIKRLAQHDPETAARIAQYAQIIAFRNVLIHGYDLVDHGLVWSTVQTQVPALLRDVAAILDSDR
jgi:hypothetical protein